MSSQMPNKYPTWCDVARMKKNIPPIVMMEYLVKHNFTPMQAAMMVSYPYQGPLCERTPAHVTCHDYSKVMSPDYLSYTVYK